MIKYKKILTGVTVALSAFAFGQSGSSSARQYPSMYENQTSINLPGTVTPAADKIVLSAKELVDINLNTMMTDSVLKNAKWGFVLYDPKTKKVISSYNESTPLIPASTTKLLTTESALNFVGEKFRWVTQLEYAGEIDEEGVLDGNLYIVGSGDPTLGTGKAGASTYSSIVKDFGYALAENGIKKVTGNIYVQTAVFKENKLAKLPANIVWMEQKQYYLPVGTTMNINPANERLIAKKNNPFQDSKNFYYVSPYINQIVYADKFEGGSFTTKIADAPYSLANALRASLIKSGIPVVGKVEGKIVDLTPEKRKVVTAYRSPMLADIVIDTNQRSDNALSEAMLRMLGFQRNGDQTLDSGRRAVLDHLNEIGFDVQGLSYLDGSGLSRGNTVTPIAQVKFLTDLMNEKYYKTFFESLPIAGQTGTLKKSFAGIGNGQIFAKTGTLNKVKTLAGFVKTNTGRTLAFSLMVNNYSGSVDQVKNRMEKILAPTLNL